MRASELKSMTDAELNAKLVDLKSELFNLRFRHSTRQLENPRQLVNCKKDIARVKTIIRERQLNIITK